MDTTSVITNSSTMKGNIAVHTCGHGPGVTKGMMVTSLLLPGRQAQLL